MSKQCDIVQDLLPLYVDGACSDASAEMIKEHLETCADCRAIYEQMCSHTNEDVLSQEKNGVIARHKKSEQKKFGRKIVCISLVILLAVVSINIILVSTAKNVNTHSEYLLQNGPWNDEGIWKDSDSNIYLICSKVASDQFAEVTAYIFIDNNWESFPAHIRKNIIFFEDSEGTVQFTAKANLNNQTLTLSKFEFKKEFSGIDKKELTLSKYAWDEEIEQIPFDLH